MKITKEKRYMTWKYTLVFSLILMSFLFISSIQSKAEEPEIIDGELMILIDDSQSVSTYCNYIYEWAEKIGFYVQDTGIKVTVIKFDSIDSTEIIYSDRILHDKKGNSQLSEYIDALENMEFNKNWTDQKGAFAHAVKIMNDSEAKRKCIVMLSDAILDYNDDSEEECAKKEFVEDVNAYANGKNQEVILVGFGDDTELFKSCTGAEVLSGSSEKVLLEEALGKLFIGVGYKNENINVTIENNQTKFPLVRDVYRLILIFKNGNTIEESSINTISVNKNREALKPYSTSLTKNSYILYFPDAKKGDYVVTLPEGNWECNVITQDKILISNVELSIMQNVCSAFEGSYNDVYNITEENFTLEARVDAAPDMKNSYLDVQYCITEARDTNQKNYCGHFNSGYNEKAKCFQQEINLGTCLGIDITANPGELNGTYKCWVIIKQGDIILYESTPIVLNVEIMQPTSTQVSEIEKQVGDTIDICEIFNVQYDNKYYIALGEERIPQFCVTSNVNIEEYEYKDGKLTFLKENEYLLSIINEKGEIVCDAICLKVTKNEEKDGLLQWILNFIFGKKDNS